MALLGKIGGVTFATQSIKAPQLETPETTWMLVAGIAFAVIAIISRKH